MTYLTMNVGLIVYGSNCDVDPMVSFAKQLANRGHRVEIFIISIHNRDYSFLNKHSNLLVFQKRYTREVRNSVGDNLEYWSLPLDKHFDLMDKWYKAVVDEIVEWSYRFCERNNVIVGPQHILETACIAEKFGLPYVSLRTLPGHVRSAKIPPYWLSFFDMGDMSYDTQWDVLERHENRSLKRYINRFRKQHGLKKISNVMRDLVNSPWLNLISYSKHLHKEQDDWCPSFHLCGFFRPLNEFVDWLPNQALLSFCLGVQKKPILISIYSMFEYENKPAKLVGLLAEAAQISGERVILHCNIPDAISLPENCFLVSELVDFYKLIPLCRLIVHHGSIGLSHISTELGCPSLTIKYGCDHPFNTEALEKVGVLSHSVYRSNLTANVLALAIRESLDSSSLEINAASMSQLLKMEKGVDNAVNCLELAFAELQEQNTDSARRWLCRGKPNNAS